MYRISRASLDDYSEVFTEFKLRNKHSFTVDTSYHLLDEADHIDKSGYVMVSFKGMVNDSSNCIELKSIKTEFVIPDYITEEIEVQPQIYLDTLTKIGRKLEVPISVENIQETIQLSSVGMCGNLGLQAV